MSRLASPEDIAAAVAHLASPDMGYVTGQILYVDGGFLSAGIITR
jgi:NAD(P)-dependent dehydrogenase (short-subunit alcohol dehydrogenase family)